MGQYYKIVNVDKRELLDPYFGCKLMEWSYQGNHTINALINLLQDRWKGDRVYVVGDYADMENDGTYACWQPTYKQIAVELGFDGEVACKDDGYISEGYPITLYAYASKNFEDISEKVPHETIEKDARYIYNHKHQCVIDLAKLPVTHEGFDYSNGRPYCMYISPLSLLLAMGNGRGGGDYYSEYPGYELVGSWCETSQDIEISGYMIHPEYDDFEPGFTEMRGER